MNYHNITKDDMIPIPGFENYLIDTMGHIYSMYKNTFLNPWHDTKGYLTVELRVDRKRYYSKVHRLVAITFIPNPDNLPEVNHKDENKDNCEVSNLEWCTTKYNCNYGTRNKRVSISNRSTELKFRRPIVQLDKQFNLIRKYPAIERVKEYGFCQPNVVAALHHRRPTVNGYIFMYEEEYQNELSQHNKR